MKNEVIIMRFLKTDFDQYDRTIDILEVEKPYLSAVDFAASLDKERYVEIPSTLVGLAQIAEYYKERSEFHALQSVSSGLVSFDRSIQNKIHQLSKKLVSHLPEQWESEFERVIEKIALIDDRLIQEQILPKKAMLKNAMILEANAISEGAVLFWRFDQQGNHVKCNEVKQTDGFTHSNNVQISISDNLLAGYIRDGKFNNDPMCGLFNYGACTFMYHDVHSKLLYAANNQGKYYIEGKEKNLSLKYIDAQGPLQNHQLYAIKLTYEETRALVANKTLIVSSFPESASVCFGAGEEFHPHIKLKTMQSIVDAGKKIDLYSNCVLHEIFDIDSDCKVSEDKLPVIAEEFAGDLTAQDCVQFLGDEDFSLSDFFGDV